MSQSMQLLLLLFVLATSVVSKPPDETDQSLLWGPYRPNLYFGIRPRLPQSLMTGLIWFSTLNYQSVQSTFAIPVRKRSAPLLILAFQGSRHGCEQDDKLDSYTWIQYDPREGGVQEIKDSQNNVKITTEFLKVPGGKNGGSWAARIKGEPIDPCESRRLDSIVAAKVHTRGIFLQQDLCISRPCSIPVSRVLVVLKCKTSQCPRSVAPPPTNVRDRCTHRLNPPGFRRSGHLFRFHSRLGRLHDPRRRPSRERSYWRRVSHR